uniref:Uncharacterized protein n=1 Tax=Anguilla anguilla TaxID=7936 RepID=A0A0E9XPE6_ANGAN
MTRIYQYCTTVFVWMLIASWLTQYKSDT